MDIKEYYAQVFEKLNNCFDGCHYVLGYGSDLRFRDIAQGRMARDESALPITVEPIDSLWDLAANWGLEVFMPVVGFSSRSVLVSLDYEIYLDDARRLYADRGSQLYYFNNYIRHVTGFISSKLEEHKTPYCVDLTPSGGHFLFRVNAETQEWEALKSIGFLEEDLARAYNFHDAADLKRNPPVSQDAGLVYSGSGRLWEYICLEAIRNIKVGPKELPLTLSNPVNKCVNLDITAYGDPAFMRIMRSPFSCHKKRGKVIPGALPLVDVMLFYYDTNQRIGEMDFEHLLPCMWNPKLAAEHAKQFTGFIPFANQNLVGLVEEYKESPLYALHREIDNAPNWERQEAFRRASEDSKLNGKTRHMLNYPNPRAMEPSALVRFIDYLMTNDWHPKHIGNLIADLYEQPQHGWNADWIKYPSRTKGNFWARIYCCQKALGWEI